MKNPNFLFNKQNLNERKCLLLFGFGIQQDEIINNRVFVVWRNYINDPFLFVKFRFESFNFFK